MTWKRKSSPYKKALEPDSASAILRRLEGIDTILDRQTIETLEAHANLYTLSSDINLNAGLIKKGYAIILDIAKVIKDIDIICERPILDFTARTW